MHKTLMHKAEITALLWTISPRETLSDVKLAPAIWRGIGQLAPKGSGWDLWMVNRP